jgi:hypothetical protein
MAEPAAPPPIACTLDAAGAERQRGEWAALRTWWLRTEEVDGRARVWFGPEAEPALRAVAAKEAACCAFLRLEVEADAGLMRLELSSPEAEARPVIEALVRESSGRG